MVLESVNIKLPDELPRRDCSAFVIALEQGANVLDPATWLVVDEIEFHLN